MIDIPGRPAVSMRDWLTGIVESRAFNVAITAVIVLNAVTLGLETWPPAMAAAGPLLLALDKAALWVFTVELALKVWVYRSRFTRDGWNVFDFVIVAIAWLPATGPLAVLRALRIMRVLRLVSMVPQMRAVIGALPLSGCVVRDRAEVEWLDDERGSAGWGPEVVTFTIGGEAAERARELGWQRIHELEEGMECAELVARIEKVRRGWKSSPAASPAQRTRLATRVLIPRARASIPRTPGPPSSVIWSGGWPGFPRWPRWGW